MPKDYNKFTDRHMREHPSNDDEEELANQLAEQEAQMFLDRCKTDKFTMRAAEILLRKVAHKVGAKRPVVDDDDIDTTPKQSPKADINARGLLS